jgi:hypothetical protein
MNGIVGVGPEFFEPVTDVELAEWESPDALPR